VGLCRDNGVTVWDAQGVDLTGSVMGGVNGMLAEMDRDATVARLAAGKALAKAQGKRVDGRHPYGQHPLLEFAHEREVVERMRQMRREGMTYYRITKILREEGTHARSKKPFAIQTVEFILKREGL